jgi:hypothetical protein
MSRGPAAYRWNSATWHWADHEKLICRNVCPQPVVRPWSSITKPFKSDSSGLRKDDLFETFCHSRCDLKIRWTMGTETPKCYASALTEVNNISPWVSICHPKTPRTTAWSIFIFIWKINVFKPMDSLRRLPKWGSLLSKSRKDFFVNRFDSHYVQEETVMTVCIFWQQGRYNDRTPELSAGTAIESSAFICPHRFSVNTTNASRGICKRF